MARALWKGSINFGLVNINIELYAATKQHVIGFKLLHAKCQNPIINKRWCPHCNKEVAWEETVKALKLKDDSYFIITQANLKKLKPEKTDSIAILEFVDLDMIPTIYFNHHFYVAPVRKTDRAFFLFCNALEKFGKVAIAQFVMKDKEYICVIEPFKNALSLTTLYYEYEINKVVEIDNLKIPAKIDAKELELAEILMSKLYSKKFDISKYKDTFAVKLMKNIAASKKRLKIPEKIKEEKIVEQPSIMEALKASIGKYMEPEKARSK